MKKQFLKNSVLSAVVALSVPVNASDKPQTMDEMWKTIQALQKQVEELQTAFLFR